MESSFLWQLVSFLFSMITSFTTNNLMLKRMAHEQSPAAQRSKKRHFYSALFLWKWTQNAFSSHSQFLFDTRKTSKQIFRYFVPFPSAVSSSPKMNRTPSEHQRKQKKHLRRKAFWIQIFHTWQSSFRLHRFPIGMLSALLRIADASAVRRCRR